MGDVVDFRKKPKATPKPQPFDAFLAFYEKHQEVVSHLTDQIIINLSVQLDIDEVHAYDKFMLRESIMSLIMRQKGVPHPMQDFTEDFVESYGEPPKD
jgi:hypothetical protein